MEGGTLPWKRVNNYANSGSYAYDEMSLPVRPPLGYRWNYEKENRLWSLVPEDAVEEGESAKDLTEENKAAESTEGQEEKIPPAAESTEGQEEKIPPAAASVVPANTDDESTESASATSAMLATAVPAGDHPPMFIEHIILQTDTIQGISLMYHVPIPTIKKLNCFSGNNLALAPKSLLIPLDPNSDRKIRRQDVNCINFKIQTLMCRTSNRLGWKECQFYLDDNDNDLKKASEQAIADLEWEQGQQQPQIVEIVKKSASKKPRLNATVPVADCNVITVEMVGIKKN